MKQKQYVKIYEAVKRDILARRYLPGEKLPSKRNCARQWGVSVITVESAYGLLTDEGYVEAREKSGYFVAPLPPGQIGDPLPPKRDRQPPAPEEFFIDLTRNRILPDCFPFTSWAKLMRRQLLDRSLSLLGDTGATGSRELREAIAAYLYRCKGVAVDPERIVVGAGTDHLYTLLIQLLGRDKTYGAMDPGYPKFFQICGVSGTRCLPIPIQKGYENIDPRCDVLHLTPSHHFPTGKVMDASDRIAALNWAYEKPDRYLIEDDYDSEFSYRPKPVDPLYRMDGKDRVIYMNSFSKTIAPSMRISYMILPEGLMARFRRILGFTSCCVPAIEQFTLSQFIAEGYFERHLNRAKKLYKKKRDSLLEGIRSLSFYPHLRLKEENSGLHFLVEVHTKLREEELNQAALSQGIRLCFLSRYRQIPVPEEIPAVIVNYSGIPSERIAEGFSRLEKAFSGKNFS